MTPVADQLRRYVSAVSDPTRGAILMELNYAGELTATQLARRLGLTPNNVYHHMRVLLRSGVVDPPRAVPGDTYVEKYYHLNPDIRAAVNLDPVWYDEAQKSMTAEDRKAVIVSVCLTMAHLLRQAARRYEEMEPDELDQKAPLQQLDAMWIEEISRERLQFRLHELRGLLQREGEKFAQEPIQPTDRVLFASLPAMWDVTREQGQ